MKKRTIGRDGLFLRSSKAFRLCGPFILLLLAVGSGLAETPGCKAPDLQVSFHFYNDANTVERIVLLTRNISGHDCLLTASYPPNFAPVLESNGPPINLCQSCANRLPGGEEEARLPLLLTSQGFAHQSFRYRTSPDTGAAGCVQAGSMSTTANDDIKHPILLVSKSLLRPICSPVDVVGYRSGPGGVTAPDAEPSPGERELTLRSERATYYTDEWFVLWTDPQPATKESASVLLLHERGPGGDTRLDEVQAGTWQRDFLRRWGANQEHTADEIDAGALHRWRGIGDHSFQLFQVNDGTASGEIHFLCSRPLTVHVADAASIPRAWGPTQQGVRVDLTLDKTKFQLGEDIAAHIAAQVVDAKEPVYGEPFRHRGLIFLTTAGSFHLSIRDADGPLENSDRRANLDKLASGSSGGNPCPATLEAGKVIPLNRSLLEYGLLPTRPGTYQLSVTWSPYHSRFSTCPDQRPEKPEQPFVTVTSNTTTITVVGEPPATALPPVREYTAWKKHFRLVDTPFGPLTAMLDLATGLEWLRPTFTSDHNIPVTEQSLATRIAQEKDFAGWRFATRDEVRSYFAHFTGSEDGTSPAPAVARKLLRLLGGTIEGTPNHWGWIDNRETVRIVGSPQGETWDYYAFIDERVKDGAVEATIDPNEQFHGMGQAMLEFEGGTSHYAGFFLVRQHQLNDTPRDSFRKVNGNSTR